MSDIEMETLSESDDAQFEGLGAEDFHRSPEFQRAWDVYKGQAGVPRRTAWAVLAAVVGAWVVMVVVYSQTAVAVVPGSWRVGTNVEFGGANVTLSPFSAKNTALGLDHWRSGMFYGEFRSVDWVDDERYVTAASGGRRLVVAPESGASFAVVDKSQFSYKNTFFYVQRLQVNPALPVDDPAVWHIVVTDAVDQWRHSSYALYWLYRRQTNEHIPIQPHMASPQESLRPEALAKLHFARFTPQGDTVVFGADHDLYVLSIDDMAVTRISDDGAAAILNGKCDWVYEEEVTATDTFFWVSPAQNWLAYVKTDDSNVYDYELDFYVKTPDEIGLPGPDTPAQYPVKRKIKYPKPGTPNPQVSLHLYDFVNHKTRQVDVGGGKLSVLYDAAFLDDDHLLIKETDRTSKYYVKKVYQVSTDTYTQIEAFNATDEYGGWIEKSPPVTVVDGGYIDRRVIDKRTHLVYFRHPLDTEPQVLTQGAAWEVREDAPVVYNVNTHKVYTLATMRSSMDSHVIMIDLKDSAVEALTDIEHDGVYEMGASKGGRFLELKYMGPGAPWQRIVDMSKVHHQDEFRQALSPKPLNDIKAFEKRVAAVNLPTRLHKTVKLGKVSVNVIEILPPNFDAKGPKKHPVLVHAYGGPGSQTVDKSYIVGFEDVVSAQLDAIVLIIDPRGTKGQGWEFKAWANNRIGYWEGRDIINVVNNYLVDNAQVVDASKVALWGWSYGGFTTLKTLELDKGDVFKFGMAVAPVTNWLFYDSIYTERYMNLPSENPNYGTTARISSAGSFKAATRLLVMHGTADDNVHLQNSLYLLDQLNAAAVENYDVRFFPDNDHAIRYHNSNVIVYDKLFHWLKDAFSGKFDDQEFL